MAPRHPRTPIEIAQDKVAERSAQRAGLGGPTAAAPKSAKPKAAAPKPKRAAPPSEEDEAEAAPARASSRAPMRQQLRQSVHRPMSDADILREFEGEEADQFFIDPDIIPDGLTYEWKRLEVYGQPDVTNAAEVQRNRWHPVMAQEHDGYFMPPGFQGHVLRGGLGLYKMESELYARRQRYNQIVAAKTVNEQQQRLGLAPKGTGPREHPKVKPRVVTEFEAAPNDIE